MPSGVAVWLGRPVMGAPFFQRNTMPLKDDEADAAEVRRLLDYSPSTGIFVWKEKRCAQMPAGSVAGGKGKNGYALLRFRGKTTSAHRLAWLHFYGEWPKQDIDHINGVRNDNRITNLRDVSRAVNLQNSTTARRGKTAGLRGVSLRHGRLEATIKTCGKTTYLGSFVSADDAHSAYLAARRIYHKEARRT